MSILFNLESDPYNEANIFTKLYISKIGQFPGVERRPEKEVLAYISDEDATFYKNALSNLAVGYSIGAMVYLRRITENEIKRIVLDISKMEYSGADQVRKSWERYLLNHQMSGLMESIYPFLPVSLREDGDNPLKILYDATSENLHSSTDEQALENAIAVSRLLSFVIKRVKMMKDELRDVRNAIAQLKKSGQ